MKPRRGITLLEMAVAIALVGILMAGTAVLLTTGFQTNSQIRRDVNQQQALARLNQRFRADAHAARTCDVAAGCQFTLPDGQLIQYSWLAPRIEREVRRAGEVVHRDAFELPAAAGITFAADRAGSRQLAHLQIESTAETATRFDTVVRPARIEAVVDLALAAADSLEGGR
jgi:prepilin-type N-terminal cleavage/methylation domain-containing protein